MECKSGAWGHNIVSDVEKTAGVQCMSTRRRAFDRSHVIGYIHDSLKRAFEIPIPHFCGPGHVSCSDADRLDVFLPRFTLRFGTVSWKTQPLNRHAKRPTPKTIPEPTPAASDTRGSQFVFKEEVQRPGLGR